MNITQLELSLWQQLNDAVAHPEEVNVALMAAELGHLAAISDIPLLEQLRLVAEATLQLSEICMLRSDEALTQWQQTHDPTEPVVDLSDTVLYLQTQHLDLSDLYCDEGDDPVAADIADSITSPNLSEDKPKELATDSAVRSAPIVEIEAPKDQLIQLVEALVKHQPTDIQEQIRALAHDESVYLWQSAIADQVGHGAMDLTQIHQALNLSIVQVWLVGLLGNFVIQPKESAQQKEAGNKRSALPITAEQFYLSPASWSVQRRE